MPNKSKKKMGGRPRGGQGSRGVRGFQQENHSSVAPRGPNVSTLLSRQIAGVPQTRRGSLAWFAGGNLAVAANSYVEQATILNNPYDPDPTFGGESAQGYAKWMAFYSKCFVLRAHWRISFCNCGTTANEFPSGQTLGVGVTVTTNGSSLTSVINAITAGLSQWKLLGINPDTVSFQGTTDVGAFLNKPQVLDDPQLFSTSGAGPTQVIALHSWAQNNTVVAATNATVYAEVMFDCVFTDPIPFT